MNNSTYEISNKPTLSVNKRLKGIRMMFRMVMAGLLGLYLLLLTFVNFGPTQQILTQLTQNALEDQLQTDVQVGKIEIGLFNRITIRDLVVKDKQSKELLNAKLVSAKISLRSIFRAPLTLRTVSLLDTRIRLYKEEANAPCNFQFIIDKFSNKEKHGPSTINFAIKSIILRRVHVSYDEMYRPATPHRFNTSHLNISDIDANISLQHITRDVLKLRVRSLRFREDCGLHLSDLHLKLNATRKHALIEDLDIKLQQSHLSCEKIQAYYDLSDDFTSLLSTIQAKGVIKDAVVSVDDIRPFANIPNNLDLSIKIGTYFSISPSQIKFTNCLVEETKRKAQLKGNVTLSRNEGKVSSLTANVRSVHLDNAFITQQIKLFSKDSTVIHAIGNLGDIDGEGTLTYQLKDKLSAHIEINTACGELASTILWNNNELSANFNLSRVEPERIVENSNLPTELDISGNILTVWKNNKLSSASGNVMLHTINWHNNIYKGIRLSGKYEINRAEASLRSDDTQLKINLDGSANLKGTKVDGITLLGKISDISPALLGYQTRYDKATFSADIDVDMSGITLHNPRGHVQVQNFEMKNSPRGNFHLQNLQATFIPSSHEQENQLRIASDFINGTISGPLSTNRFMAAIQTIVQRSLPGALPFHHTSNHDVWHINTTINQTDFFDKILGVSVNLDNSLRVEGTIDGSGGRTSLSIYGEGISFNNQRITNPRIYISGHDSTYQCIIQAVKQFSQQDYKIAANLHTQDGELVTRIDWSGSHQPKYNGAFESCTSFSQSSDKKHTNFNMHIRPTTFFLADSLWNISSGNIAYNNRCWAFEDVNLGRAEQSLRIDGQMTPHHNDSIVAHLKNIDIDYILGLVNFHAVEFGGRASGDAVFSNSTGTPQLHARLNVPDFTFNKGEMGNAQILGNWNPRDNRINLFADMKLPEGNGAGTKVEGYVSLRDRALRLDIEANRTNIQFLRPYVQDIFYPFSGNVTGHVCLYGPFKQLDFEGDVRANAHAKVKATGVEYSVTDGEMLMLPGEFAFKHFPLDDGLGGKGVASGYLRHTHFKNMNYGFNITANRLLCYDLDESADMPFSSRTIGTGAVSLQGRPGQFFGDITLRPDNGTTLTYNMGNQSSQSKDDSMIRFHDLTISDTTNTSFSFADREEAARITVNEKKNSATDIKLNFLIQATPAAEVKIITDPRTGDALTVYGEGAIRAKYHNMGDFEMFGAYKLRRGTYKLRIQDIIHKELNLQDGSSITFSGSPLEAALNLKAVYTVNSVSLADLNYGAGFSQKTVRADCILNIGGKAKSPQIDFDIDLHNISEDEKQMIRGLIATDEDINRQAIYLLGFGRFYMSGSYASVINETETSNASNQSAAAMRSFLSTTVTSQFNQAISSAMGNSSKWSFGVNVAPGTMGWNEIEADGLVQGRMFNDRLLFNGNFGYRDNATYYSGFVGDFDLRYLLTPRGGVSLRAYSETNDRYFTKSSLTTQGIGISLQREFNKLGDLFKRNKRQRKKVAASPSAQQP